MKQWDYAAYERACALLPPGHFQYQSRDALDAFLTEYWGKPTICTALVEGCNVSNGYPYYVFYHRELKPEGAGSEESTP